MARSPFPEFEAIPDLWPLFTESQVAFLESKFPARCLKTSEAVEDHLRYAGKVDLIAQLREHVIGSPGGLMLTDDEEEALDDVAAGIAAAQQKQQGE